MTPTASNIAPQPASGQLGLSCTIRQVLPWAAALTFTFGFSASVIFGADEASVARGGPVVQLPEFEVTDSSRLPQPEKWLSAEIPGFEILSNMSKRGTQRFVQDFLLLQEAM